MLTKTRPFTSARSMRRSTAAPNASSAATTSSRSMPRSSANRLRVPAGTTTNGTSAAIATLDTSACDPSPPAMPMTSAPRSIARRASSRRSSPGWRTIASMPRCWHSSTSPNRSTFPPPDFAFMMRTPRCRAAHRGPRHRLRAERPPIATERVADEEGGRGEQRQHHDQGHAVALGGQHDGDGERQEQDGGDGGRTSGRPLARRRDPGRGGHQQQQQRGHDQLDRDHLGGRRRPPPGQSPTSTRAPTAAARRIGSSRRSSEPLELVMAPRAPSVSLTSATGSEAVEPATRCLAAAHAT